MRRPLVILAACVVVAILAVGLSQAGGDRAGEAGDAARSSPAQTRRALTGAPPALARLHAQAGELLPGGPAAFRARLRELRGHPVVVNKWASWCGPCRLEFPAFRSQAIKQGRRVAFVGVNSADERGAAERFLRSFDVSFPSYEDPGEKIAREIGAGKNYPITVFYDATGKQSYIHQGAYRSEADLAADIRRHARPS